MNIRGTELGLGTLTTLAELTVQQNGTKGVNLGALGELGTGT